MNTQIRSITDVPEAIEEIRNKHNIETPERINAVSLEIESELAFDQFYHVSQGNDLSTYPGLEQKAIEIAIDRGLNNPISQYPTTTKVVKQDKAKLTEMPDITNETHRRQNRERDSLKRKAGN